MAREVVDGQPADEHRHRQHRGHGHRDHQRRRALVRGRAAAAPRGPARRARSPVAVEPRRAALAPLARARRRRRPPAARTPASRPRRARRRGCPREGRRSRRTARARGRPRSGSARPRPPAGRASWASRGWGPRRCSPRRSRRSRRSAAGECVDTPISACGPSSARTSLAGMSSWPTCTPSAPASRATDGRSLTISSAPRRSHSARASLAIAVSSSSGRCFSRSCTTSTPPAIAPRSRLAQTALGGAIARPARARAADEVQARLRQARAALGARVFTGGGGHDARSLAGLASSACPGRSESTCSSSGPASSAWRSPGARARRGCRWSCSIGGAPAAAPRAWRRGCSRRWPRSSSARPAGGCWSSGCARRGCGPRSPRELELATGVSVGLMRTGTLLVARDEDDARELERQLDFRRSLGLAVRRLRASEARELEPALAPTVRTGAGGAGGPLGRSPAGARGARAGLRVGRSAGARPLARGARRARRPAAQGDRGFVTEARARPRATGVTLEDGQWLPAEQVVLAAGPWSGQIEGASPSARRAGTPGQGPDPAPARPRRAGAAASACCAFAAATSSRARTARTCSGRPSRSAASSSRRPPAACTSCCATRTSSSPASASWRSRSCRWACGPAPPTTPR